MTFLRIFGIPIKYDISSTSSRWAFLRMYQSIIKKTSLPCLDEPLCIVV